MERIYADANIFLDYLENRTDNIRSLGEFAFQLFRRTLECEFFIVSSDWVLEELKASVQGLTVLNVLLRDLRETGKIEVLERTESEAKEAKKLSKNWTDALHALIAKRGKAEFIVTRDTKHFLEFSDLLEPKLPEDL